MKAKYINIRLFVLWRHLFSFALAFLVLALSWPHQVRAEIRQIDPYGPDIRFIQNIKTVGTYS
jgi:hypothetical protein